MASSSTLTKLSYSAFNQLNSRLCVRKWSAFSRLLSSSMICSKNPASFSASEGVRTSFIRQFSCNNWLGIKASVLTVEKMKKCETGIGCPICRRDITFTYKDVLFLAQFLSPRGYILNRRVTGVCKKQQRKLEKSIKISQRLGLLPKLAPLMTPP